VIGPCLDKKWDIFSGFTPVKWDSSNDSTADLSLKSFIVTLKNLHDFSSRKHAISRRDSSVACDDEWDMLGDSSPIPV
jgi:hypothetical protein